MSQNAERAGLRQSRLRAGATTRQIVHETLRWEIVSLALAPGTALSEAEIAARFGISRTPVRESLIMLAGEGLVEVLPQRGTFVGPINYDAVVAAQFIREALECTALQLGGADIGEGTVRELRDALARQRTTSATGDGDGFFLLDEQFHRELLAATGHVGAWGYVSQAKAHMDRARRLSLPQRGKLEELTDQHASVVEAVAAGEIERAVSQLRNHLRVVLDDIAQIRLQQPAFFSDAHE